MQPIPILRRAAVLILLCAGTVLSAEPTQRETEAAAEAVRREERSEWPGAGHQWEQALSIADQAGDDKRAIAHGERALAAWRQASGGASLDRQAFTLGVMSKLDLRQGRLTRGRERNLAALRIIAGRIGGSSDWQPAPGKAPPATVPPAMLEAWARAQNDAANWLDAQGHTVEAVELLTATEASMRAAAPGGAGFYHRKLLSTRANFLKFLGFQERAIRDLQRLADSRGSNDGSPEWASRFNLAYYSSQYYGPRPEYLDTARSILRESQAAGRRARDERRLVAKMVFAYREAGADVRDLEEIIAEAQAAGAELEAIYARRDLALLEVKLGRREGVEEALRQALAELRRRGVKRGEPTLYREYGKFLVKDGRPAEGLRMLREAVRLTRSFGWTQHFPMLLAEVATAQGRVGDLAGLAQTLAELDSLLAGGALIPEREFLAHCARARTLLLLGRDAEAAVAIARAIALADRLGFNEYQRFALSWTEDVLPATSAQTVATVAVSANLVDLQPVAVLATAEPGGTALARFRLSNPGAQAATGTLHAAGRDLSIRWEEAAGVVTISAGAAEGSGSVRLPVQIGAGEDVLIKVEAPIAEGDGNSGVRLQWQSGEHSASAVCHLRPGSTSAADEPGATVSNTSLAWENPFYAVRLHHPVQAVGGPHSFRVQPTRRCRVEVFDARSGALLAVDADGDGAFRSAGDSVAVDVDGDAFPDLPDDAASGRGEIEILIFPIPGTAPATVDTRIEVQTKTATGWKTVAHDILKAPRRP